VPRHQTGHLDGPNSPASPSPVSDGDRVYAFFQESGLTAFAADGKRLWHVPLGPFNMYYGFGASPILVAASSCSPLTEYRLMLLGVDARTGKSADKVDRPA
jgi:hypothetical protein